MRLLLPCSLVLVALSTSLYAQKSEAEVRADLAFAKGLATPWGFVDLSEEVIRGVEAGTLSGKLADEVALLKCSVYFEAAKFDTKRRDELLKRSLDAYAAFIANHGNSELREVAEAGLVEASAYSAKSIALKLEEAVGDQAVALKAELQDLLTTSIAKTSALLDAYGSVQRDARTEADQRKLFGLMRSKADMLAELGKAQDDGTFSFAQSRKTYEKLSDEAGEGSPWSLFAFIGIGDLEASLGNFVDAASFYEFAVNFSIPIKSAEWQAKVSELNIGQEEKQARFLFVQLGTAGLIKSLVQSGDTPGAIKWGLHFHNTWRREGLDLVAPTGYLALLEVARSMVDAGGFVGGNASAGDALWYESQEAINAAGVAKNKQKSALDFALSLAQQVNQDNKGNNLQVRAQKVIAEIISRPGIAVDPNVLLDAALGSFYESEWIEAIDALKTVVVALYGQDTATRQEQMSKVLWHIGRSYQKLERNLEAAATYETALELWRGDPQYDEQNAKGFIDSATALKRAARGDPVLDALVQRAETIVSQIDTGGAVVWQIAFRNAEKAYDAKKFDEAKQLYASIEPAGPDYEKARVSVGVCAFQIAKLGKFDAQAYREAITVFDAYFKWVADPKNGTIDPKRLAVRKAARANATFYWGLALFALAEQKQVEWTEVVDKLDNFQLEFPEQTQLAPAALYRVVVARAKLDQNAEVKALLAEMIKLYPDSRWTGNAAKESYDMLNAAWEAQQDPARKLVILREMAENLQTLNKTSSKAVFGNMRQESKHWVALQEWATAEELLERILAQFSTDAACAEDLQKFILPDYGKALLRQHKVEQATAVLKPLMDEKAAVRATRDTAGDFAMSVTGWIEYVAPDGQNGKVQEVPGSGATAEDFNYAVVGVLTKIVEATEKWTAEWYRLKAQQIYALTRWVQFDGTQLATAKSQLTFLVTQLGTQFKADGLSEDTRQLFLWLAAKLK